MSLQIEKYRRKNEARKFYQKVKGPCNGHGSGLPFCKDKDGNLVTDPECMLQKLREHFSKLLVPDISDENVIEELL